MHNFNNLSPDSRVWIYQSDRNFSNTEEQEIRHFVQDFADKWVSHQQALKAWGNVLHGRFVVLIADETDNQAGGCSIDESTRFISALENKFGVSLFDRLNIAINRDGNIEVMHKDELIDQLKSGQINSDVLMFNNLVASKSEFENKWQVPIKDSWLSSVI